MATYNNNNYDTQVLEDAILQVCKLLLINGHVLRNRSNQSKILKLLQKCSICHIFTVYKILILVSFNLFLKMCFKINIRF